MATGGEVFYISYTLYDKYHNPTSNQSVWINTTVPGEELFATSTSSGVITRTYGPRDVKARITITATTVANHSVTAARTVEFFNTPPTHMILLANPETMASHDVNSAQTSAIKAKVMDERGNPVVGETVTFSIGSVTYNGNYSVTSAPTPPLSASAATHADGFAIVQFQPGGFTQNFTDPLYSPTATGQCKV